LPTEVGYNVKLQSGQDPGEDNEHADELPWDCFWQFVQKCFDRASSLFHQLSGWLISDHPASEEAGCGGPGLTWLHGLRLWGRLDVLPNPLKCCWRHLMVAKWIFNGLATDQVNIPAANM
jgi:hypothetical protein